MKLSPLLFCLACYSLLQADPIISVYAIDTKTQKILKEENSSMSLIPASCMKLITTAAALELLGEDYQFATHLEYDGECKQGALQGNLYIRGGGDPSLGSSRSALSWKEQIVAWADVIQAAGIQKISGQILSDTSAWPPAQVVSSWLWEDIGNYYGAAAHNLCFCENAYELTFQPGLQEHDPTTVLSTNPPLPLDFLNEVKTGPKGSGDQACIFGSTLSALRSLQGTIPLGKEPFTIKGSIPDPGAICCQLLATELKKRGIDIAEKSTPSSTRTLVHTTLSPPLKELVKWTNTRSINLYAEQLLHKLGELKKNEGSTQAGLLAIKDFLESRGISTKSLSLHDGSGLSRKNLLTAKQLTQLLVAMKDSPAFFASLPEVYPGMRAKTGTMSQNKALAGYCGDIAFTIFINHCTDPDYALSKMERICTELSAFSQMQSGSYVETSPINQR